MKSFPAGLTVKLTLPFTDQNGDPVSPAGLSYIVSDLDGLPVVARTVLPVAPTDTDTDITIPSRSNILAPGEISGGRVVTLSMETANGIYQQRETYVLRAYERLVPPRNSFMTDAAAQALALDIPGLTGLAGANATDREAALIEAHTRIARVPVTPVLTIYYRRAKVYDRHSWPDVTADDFRTIHQGLKRALMRAQLREANDILASDPVRDRRRAGILSQRTGESSVILSPITTTETPASPEAMIELAGFIVPGSINPHSVGIIL
ncbi:hypothetical protein [Methylobacterium sp. 88A]|uniref:hypothetical protein n=1 Tax=Methylobacterium sp. 88A TaxID=1131813 RepID=UPI000370842A|nr:hypothetical protein [Methylobacterium sp. 88A]